MDIISRENAIALKKYLRGEEPLSFGQWYYDLDLSDGSPPAMYIAKDYTYIGGTISTYFPSPSKRVRAFSTDDLFDFLRHIKIRSFDEQVEVVSLGITKVEKTLPDAMACILIQYYSGLSSDKPRQ